MPLQPHNIDFEDVGPSCPAVGDDPGPPRSGRLVAESSKGYCVNEECATGSSLRTTVDRNTELGRPIDDRKSKPGAASMEDYLKQPGNCSRADEIRKRKEKRAERKAKKKLSKRVPLEDPVMEDRERREKTETGWCGALTPKPASPCEEPAVLEEMVDVVQLDLVALDEGSPVDEGRTLMGGGHSSEVEVKSDDYDGVDSDSSEWTSDYVSDLLRKRLRDVCGIPRSPDRYYAKACLVGLIYRDHREYLAYMLRKHPSQLDEIYFADPPPDFNMEDMEEPEYGPPSPTFQRALVEKI